VDDAGKRAAPCVVVDGGVDKQGDLVAIAAADAVLANADVAWRRRVSREQAKQAAPTFLGRSSEA